MFRSVLVGAVLSVVVACGPQVPVPDAGSAGGGAGGGVAMGGGRAGGQGGGGGSSGTDAGQGDGGCTRIAPLTPNGDVEGEFTIGTPMRNNDFEWWTASFGAQTQGGLLNLFISELYQPKARRVTFPLSVASFPPNTNWVDCEICFRAFLGCDMTGNCQAEYLATSGTFFFDAGVANPDGGIFVGVGTEVLYRNWDFQNDRPASANCFITPQISFRATWSFPGPSTDGGTDADGGTAADGGLVTPDGGQVMDAGVIDSDGGSTSPDAGSSDAGTTTPDAGGTPDGGDGGR